MEDTLHNWSVSLINKHKLFSRDLPLSPTHFETLVKDRNLRPILSYLVRHVVPLDQARLIRLNLRHANIKKSLKEEGEESSSLHEYVRLKTALMNTKTAIAADTKDISHLNQQMEELRHKEVEARRKATLVRKARQDTEELVQVYTHWNTHLTDLKESQQREEKRATKPTLAIKNKIHRDLLDLERIHQTILRADPHTSNFQSVHEMKEGVWERINESVDESSPRCVLEGVIGETREGQHTLHTLLQGIDLNRDARDLRVKCESDGTFIDEVNPCGVIESVQELLRQMSAAHVKLYLQAHRENLTAMSLTRALNILTTNITTVAKTKHEDEEVAAAVVELVKRSIALAGERAALGHTGTLISTLQHKAELAARAQTSAKEKHAQIMNFEKEIQEKVDKIQSLANNVQGGRDAVREIKEKLQSDMKEILSLTTTPTPTCSNLSKECDKLETIPLGYLHTTHMEDTGEYRRKINMSTSPLVWYGSESCGVEWKAVSQVCEGMRCWDHVFQTVYKRLLQTNALQCQIEHLLRLQESLGTHKKSEVTSSKGTEELLKHVEIHDKKQSKEATVMVEEAEKLISKGFQQLTTFTQHMSDWWEQPAKNIQVKL